MESVKKVIGIGRVDYHSKKYDRDVHARNVYVTFTSDSVEGTACRVLFLRDDTFGGVALNVGDVIEVCEDRFGNISRIFFCEE